MLGNPATASLCVKSRIAADIIVAQSIACQATTMSDVTRILSQIEDGDPSAAQQLLPLVYNELRKLAAAKLAREKPGQTLQATLPDIHLTDLGKDRGGADPAVLVDQIVTAVTEQIVVAVAGVDLEGLLEGATGQAKEQLQGVLEDAAGEGAGRALQELEGAGERLKGVLRGN